MSSKSCYTIGHSNHPIEKFLKLLEKYNINVIVDARSVPYSKYAKDPLKCHRFHSISKELKLAGLGVQHILEDGEVKSQEELEIEDNLKSKKQISSKKSIFLL
jgi:hypothetical protein